MSNINADTLIDLLFIHFNVTTMADLAMDISVSQQTISKWKQRNSVNAIKKKCIELGIYNEIFGDLNSNINNQTIRDNNGNLSQNGDVFSSKNNDNLNIDKAVFTMFERAYNKCLDENNEVIEDKIDELIAHLTKFK